MKIERKAPEPVPVEDNVVITLTPQEAANLKRGLGGVNDITKDQLFYKLYSKLNSQHGLPLPTVAYERNGFSYKVKDTE